MKSKQKEIDRFLRDLKFLAATDETTLGYQDPFATEQQLARDEKVTELLGEYVNFYKGKVRHSTACRYIILIPRVIIICVFAGLLVYLAIQIVESKSPISASDLAVFITACVSFISLIIGLLTIITKYFFPENDEQYIANIVESTQKNDLENKRENAKHEHGIHSQQ